LLLIALCFVAVLADSQQQKTVRAPTFSVNLDLPPEQRWVEIGLHYKPQAAAIAQYFYSQLDPIAADLIEAIAPSWFPCLETMAEK